MSNEVNIPKGLTAELTTEIQLWFKSIKEASKTHNHPDDAFEFHFFRDFFDGLNDDLQKEILAGGLVDELTQLSLELMFPKYLRTIKKKIEGILDIKGLNYHDSHVVSYNHVSELHVVRVLGGLLYQSYACNPHTVELNLVSSNYVPCTNTEINDMCKEMVIQCIDSYKPYIPSAKLSRLREKALLNNIKNADYAELATDVL